MVTVVPMDRMIELISDGISCGAERLSLSRFSWRACGDCTDPYLRELTARPEARETMDEAIVRSVRHWVSGNADPGELHAGPDGGPNELRPKRQDRKFTVVTRKRISLQLDLYTRCNRCERCRRSRAALWSMRAVSECQVWPRTWFGTLTLRPEEHFRMRMLADLKEAAQGVDFAALPHGEQFVLRHRQISPELTKYIKRVREESGARCRYLLVAEQHKSGDPHYHMLMHETGVTPVRHRTLSEQWKLGFSQWKLLADVQQARYLCKYLSKSKAARVRASRLYGDALAGIANEVKRGMASPVHVVDHRIELATGHNGLGL